jgi:aminopeptidase YwaD
MQRQIPERIAEHLDVLVGRIGPRPPGSEANRRATDYLCEVLDGAGLLVDAHRFACSWWEPGPGTLTLPGGSTSDVAPNPFSRPCAARGRVTRIGSRAALEELDAADDRIVVLDGELAAQPYFPKGFPFLRLDDQLQVIGMLEALQPSAVVAVAATDPPFAPLFEDADLAFPSTTVAPELGRLLDEGTEVELTLGGVVHDGKGVNVSGRMGDEEPRIVVAAHIDSKVTTPGAFDNAGGVAALLALAEFGGKELEPVELVFFNGEDHYSAPGEQAWLAATDLSTVELMINVDGAGIVGRRSSVATLSCDTALEERVAQLVARHPGWVRAAPWFESDHAIFALQGIPSLAITSEGVHDLLRTLAHTPEDTLDKVDVRILAGVTELVRDAVRLLPAT